MNKQFEFFSQIAYISTLTPFGRCQVVPNSSRKQIKIPCIPYIRLN
nr:MAG TPA: hypothetical protein [Caudoviricetes sp.]